MLVFNDAARNTLLLERALHAEVLPNIPQLSDPTDLMQVGPPSIIFRSPRPLSRLNQHW